MRISFFIVLGALALFLGSANPLVHVPLVACLYPATLYILALRAPDPLRAGWLCGLFGASAALYWIAIPVHDYGGLPWYLAVPCPLLLGAYIGLWGGLFSKAVALLKHAAAWRRCLVAALLWYMLEWVRGWFCTGFPWLSLAAGQGAWPALVQGASVIGAYGLSGLYAGLAVLLAEFYLQGKKGWIYGLVAGLGLATLLGAGQWRVNQWHDRLAQGTDTAAVTLVQGSLNQAVKWNPAYQQRTVNTYMELSRRAVATYGQKQPGIELVVWPETSMPFYFQNSPEFSLQIAQFVPEIGPLLFGGPGFRKLDPAKATDVYNRAFLLDKDGKPAGYYDKEHLVPFGEYVPPVLDAKIFAALVQGAGGFTPGTATLPLLLPSEKLGSAAFTPRVLGLLICYEAIFPELAQQRVAEGATLLVNISNDAWYNYSSAATQHLHLSLLRAVEQQRYMVRATNTGISAFIEPTGRISSKTELFESTFLTDTVQPLTSHSVYFYVHSWLPGLVLALLALLAGLPALWSFAQQKKKGVSPASSPKKERNTHVTGA